MSLLPIPIRKEEYTFYSDKSPEELRREMQERLNSEAVNLSGTCTYEGEFKMSLAQTSLYVRVNGQRRPIASLQGSINTDAYNRTAATLWISPHYVLRIFFFLFPLAGAAVLGYDILNHKNDINSILFAAGFIVAVPVFAMLLGWLGKKQLKETFEKAFDLRESEKGVASYRRYPQHPGNKN